MRQPNTTFTGSKFDDLKVEIVWRMGTIIPNTDPAVYRLDVWGTRIEKAKYGQRVPTGWEIDHRIPVSANGPDDFINLQPLQWQNNRAKGDRLPPTKDAVVSASKREAVQRLAFEVEKEQLQREWEVRNPGETMPMEWHIHRILERIQREIRG